MAPRLPLLLVAALAVSGCTSPVIYSAEVVCDAESAALEAVGTTDYTTSFTYHVTDPGDGGTLIAGPYSGQESPEGWLFAAVPTGDLGVEDCDGAADFEYVFEASDGIRAVTVIVGLTSDTSDVVGDSATGSELYSATCAGCHGADGVGGLDVGGTPSANLTERVPALDDEALTNAISAGVGTAMPSQYTDTQDIADVIAYLRATFP